MYNKITILLIILLTNNIFSSENKLHIKTGNKNNYQYRGIDQKTNLSFLHIDFDSSKNSDITYHINANEKISENIITGKYRVSKSKVLINLNTSYHLYSGNSEDFNNLRNNLSTSINVKYKFSKYIHTFLNNEVSYDNYSLGYNGSLGVKLTPFSSLLSFKTDINWLMYESLSFLPYSVNLLSQLSLDATPIIDIMFRTSVYLAMFPFIIIMEALTGNSFFDDPATGIVFLNTKFGVSYYFNKSNINPEKLAPKLSASLNYNF